MTDLGRTLPEVLASAARRWPERVAVQEQDLAIPFSELENRAKNAARALIAAGLQPGERFAIWAPNIHEWIWVALGGHMAGGVLVPLNTRYKGIEAGDILRRANCRLLFTVSGFLGCDYPTLIKDESLPELQQIILMRGEPGPHKRLADFLESGREVEPVQLERRLEILTGDCLSDIMYTSGTTGQPKGVMSNHGQVVEIFDGWSRAVGLNANDRYLIVNPFFHTFGYKAGWLACLLRGATALPHAVFEAGSVLELIASQGISMLPGPPTLFQSLLQHEQLRETDLSSLRCAVTGAASVPEQLVRDMKNVLGFDDVFTGYGLTECGVVSICRQGDDFDTIANTAGRALPGVDVRVVDDQRQAVPAGQPGRILVRGHHVMQGYFNDPESTARAIDAEGWLDTGDIGWRDARGYIKVTDRASDMYICGGFNCYPAEIENILLQHPSIRDVAITHLTDERLGDVGHAFVFLAPDAPPEVNDLIDWARANMANYKVPRQISIVSELPRNASGKVQKFKLASEP